MSTRCQVFVEGSDVIIYRHSDGYPEGVLPDLLPTVKRFNSLRPNDSYYLSARVLGGLLDANREMYNAIIAERKAKGEEVAHWEESRDTVGFGVEAYNNGEALHGDIEYLYIVKADHVEIRQPTRAFWESDKPTLSMLKLHSRVDFDGKPYNDPKPPAKRRKREVVA